MLKVFTGILSLFHSPGATTLDKELAYSNRALSDNWKELASIRQKNKVSPQAAFVEQSKKLLKDRHNLYAKQRGLASSKFPRGNDDINVDDKRGAVVVGTYTFDTCFGFQSKEMSDDTWMACEDTLKSLNEHWCKWHNDKTFCNEAMKCFDKQHNHLFGAGNDKLYGAGKHREDGNCIECLFNNKGPVTGAICSGHGSCDNNKPKCECEDGYQGDDCSKCKFGYKLKSKRTCSDWADGQTCAGGIGRKEKVIVQQVDFYSAEDSAISNGHDFDEEYEHNFYDDAEIKAAKALKECQDWCDSYERSGRHDFCCQYDPDTHKCYYSHSTEVHKFKPRRFRTRVCKTQKIENECVKCDLNERPSVHPILRTNICVPCPPYNFYNKSSGKCEHCPEGQYTDDIYDSKQNCKACPAGSYCSKGVRKECAAGTYQDDEEKAECKTCRFFASNGDKMESFIAQIAKQEGAPGVAFCNETNMTKVNLCDFNHYTNNNGDECNQCSPGKLANSRGVCKQCGAGTELNIKIEDCSPCTGEKVNNTDNSACEECPAGSVPNDDNSGCVACAPAQYAETGSTECKQCDAGHVSEEGAAECEVCEAGSVPNHDNSECEACQAGQYTEAGSTECKQCASGHVSYLAGSRFCQHCPAGSAPNDDQSECEACPAGHYAGEAGSAECKHCPFGQFSDKEGSAECEACQAGYVPNKDHSECEACQAGQYTEAGIFCTLCDTGHISSEGATECQACGEGFVTNADHTACENCPAGKYDRDGSGTSACVPCAAGSYRVSSTKCDKCPAGTWDKDENSTTPCDECPAGSYSSGELQPCVECLAGTWDHDRDSSTPCEPCSAGSYSPGNLGPCDECPAGSVDHDETSASPCEICAPGTYQDSPAKIGGCLSCPSGTIAPNAGAYGCDMCDSGTSAENSNTCTPCEPGTYDNDTNPATTCVKCPAGTAAFDAGETECVRCRPGMFSDVGAATCSACQAGKFSNGWASTYCTVCPAGTSSNNKTMCTECKPCNTNHYASSPGMKVCTHIEPCKDGENRTESINGHVCEDCAKGYGGKNEQCHICASGKYSNTTKATECKLKKTTDDCEDNEILDGGDDPTKDNECVACNVGQYILDNKCVDKTKTCKTDNQGIKEIDDTDYTKDNECGECESEKIIIIEKEIEKCSVCGNGTSKNGTVCSPCEVGKAGTFGQCNDCEAETYQDETGQTECKPKKTADECGDNENLFESKVADADNTCKQALV